ncbi:MAG TPA: serine hydrolase domain-containing protein [Verrucomicrobiae bacterium]|jgi:CubicO group peptidase (beta-lactamase class C family)|nr:serine hydrolase domain-containing protein [Verrucomicrobiae bacterium]
MRMICSAVLALAAMLPVRADKVDDFMRDAMAHHPIAGAALEVLQNGQVVKRSAYGLANLEWQIPATPETVFEIGSITKQFTAAGILLLAQDGKLSVDDKISQYLKDTPSSWQDITLRHLLTHTSGIVNYTGLDGFELRRHLTQAQFIKEVGAHALVFPPGAKWAYCNTGFNLLGYIIENVSGQRYWDFMRARIFSPLGMTNTTDRDPRPLLAFRAHGYDTNAAGQFINRDDDLTDIFSAGAIVSTVDDMARWSASLDSHQLLTPSTEAQMWTPLTLASGKTKDYGFGWFLDPWHGHQNIGHSGTTDGFSASFQRFPQDKLVIILLTSSDESGVATKVAKDLALLYLEPR